MIFYHGTTKEAWAEIQREGVLWGRRWITNNDGTKIKEVDRCTYLALDLEEAKYYGEVVLQVEYDPMKSGAINNYHEGCWQVRVYEPIPLRDINKIEI